MRGLSALLISAGLLFARAAPAQFTFTTNNGTLTITKYTGPGGAVIIPGLTNALPVTGIGSYAFVNATMTSVLIPGSVTSIGDYAFEFCASLGTAYFEGNAPAQGGTVFFGDALTVYYLPGTIGWGSSFAGAPAVELPAITITPNPTNGAVPLPVNFTAADVDSASHAVSNWTWSFGDGSTGTGQNPSHTYTNSGTFSLSVFETSPGFTRSSTSEQFLVLTRK